MRRLTLSTLATTLILLGAGCSASTRPQESDVTFTYPDAVQESPTWTSPGILPEEQIANKQVRITTAKGDIVFELFADTAPMTVSNFVYLTTGGYYDGLTFHRREEGFVIQGGDPNGDGTGGPGYTIAEELNDAYEYHRGIVAMAKRREPSTSGSQFFIMLADVALPKEYTIFGRVVEGMDVVDEIAIGDVMTSVVVEDLTQ